ncbi:MAG: sugar phosphate isomerase/epimerase [Lachnospiraceae bacterium]|nr:sugar phosphate isomerase/epimerase [Lachnospiraceae bacterium]
MRIGIRLHDTKKCPLEERLQIVRRQGFSCVHIALGKTDGLPKETDALTPGYALWLKKVFADAQLDMAVLGNYQNLAHPDPVKLKEIQHRYTAHLRFAALAGCGMVGTETGAPNEDYHYDKEANHSAEALEIFIHNLRPVIADAERFGVILAIEPVYKHIVWNPKRAREVLDRIASPNLQIIFDPVNLLDPDNLDHREEVIEEAMDLLAPEIAMIHLKDYILEDGKMNAVGCGFGEMDYRKIVEFAETKKPYIHATLENTSPETAEQSRQVIEELISKYQKKTGGVQ